MQDHRNSSCQICIVLFFFETFPLEEKHWLNVLNQLKKTKETETTKKRTEAFFYMKSKLAALLQLLPAH